MHRVHVPLITCSLAAVIDPDRELTLLGTASLIHADQRTENSEPNQTKKKLCRLSMRNSNLTYLPIQFTCRSYQQLPCLDSLPSQTFKHYNMREHNTCVTLCLLCVRICERQLIALKIESLVYLPRNPHVFKYLH